jgi:hypothetical protein
VAGGGFLTTTGFGVDGGRFRSSSVALVSAGGPVGSSTIGCESRLGVPRQSPAAAAVSTRTSASMVTMYRRMREIVALQRKDTIRRR